MKQKNKNISSMDSQEINNRPFSSKRKLKKLIS